jgi:glycosyltransferase involved in cell wall biosynthesis
VADRQISPEVSVVIPTYNRPGLLRRAVTSALAQEGARVEVIIVDDGSSPQVTADELPAEVTIARIPSEGVAAARNLGARLAGAPWVAFLDDDDWWAADHVRRLLSAASATGADFAYAATWNVSLTTGEASLMAAVPADGLATTLLHRNAIGTPSCVIVRRSLYLEVGGFDQSLAVVADWDLWIRLARVARAAAGSAPTVAYAAHDDNMSLNIPRLLAEFRRLAERHAAACRQRGIRFGDPDFPRWIAQLYRRQGRRGRAAAWYLRSARIPGWRLDALRAVGVLLGERAMGHGRRRLGGQSVPVPAWVVTPGKANTHPVAHWSEP